MSMQSHIVGAVDVGKGPTALSEKHTIVASFHDFENLPHEKGHYTTSPIISCHGHSWVIRVCPGGRQDYELGSTTYTSIYLCLKDNPMTEVTAKFTLRVGSRAAVIKKQVFEESDSKGFGCFKFLTRQDVLDPDNGYLENGTLNVYADVQIYTNSPIVWTPRKRLHLDMLAILESGKEGDICFAIDGKRFLAFAAILARRAPILAEMAEAVPHGADVSIDGIDPSMFRALLHFIYTDELPATVNMDTDARTLLEVANRFGCSRLKLIAESEIVKAGINVENAAEFLLYADAHCCALLHEAAFNVCVANPTAVKASAGWTQLKESPELLAELFGASPIGPSSESDYDTMKVATLRQKLEEKNLDVDGTREMLIQRLKDAGE